MQPFTKKFNGFFFFRATGGVLKTGFQNFFEGTGKWANGDSDQGVTLLKS
jgi:hypothetical protein